MGIFLWVGIHQYIDDAALFIEVDPPAADQGHVLGIKKGGGPLDRLQGRQAATA